MPRVTFVKSARKDNPVCKKGESYYWWKFAYRGRSFSLTYPKPQQLTQSAYFGAVYDLLDMVNDYGLEAGEEGGVETLIDEVRDSITTIQDECQSSLENMPESLQYSPTGELLQERIDACDAATGDIDYIEEPDQWQEVRDLQDEHDQWEQNEPKRADFKDSKQDFASDLFDEAYETWKDEEPEVEDFEDFDTSPVTEAIDNMLI